MDAKVKAEYAHHIWLIDDGIELLENRYTYYTECEVQGGHGLGLWE